MFGRDKVHLILPIIDPLVTDSDKYRQRAASEVLAGLLRGSKHWPPEDLDNLWSWAVERIARVYSHLKPDTLPCWEGFFGVGFQLDCISACASLYL
jgi:proteasome activator subunit 4